MNYKTPRLYIDNPIKDGEKIELLPSHVHYLANVLRLKDGDEVRIFNGQDGEWLTSFHPISKKSADLIAFEELRIQPDISKRVHLLFSPIKKQRMDFLVEKAVELGVTDLHPVITQNTQVGKINAERIQAQIVEASEQCERLTLPQLHSLEKLDGKCIGWDKDVPLLCGIERHDCPHISEVNCSGDIGFLVGPEGGFTVQEIAMLNTLNHVQAVNLGDNILRAETAAIYGLVEIV